MEYDELLDVIADYILHPPEFSAEAYQTACLCLADALGCAILALNFPECTKLLGPIVPGTIVPGGSRVPGTNYILDPILAAFNVGTLIRWLDYNDTWLAQEWAHPSDNLGALLALTDFLDQQGQHFDVKDLLLAMIQAYEIQGCLALDNSFNQIGFDHVILVKVATAGVTAKLLGCSKNQIMDALSQAWLDLGPLRTYRHAPNTGSRKSWAAGDATSRGLQLAFISAKGEMGYPHALSAPRWGLNDVLFKEKPLTLSRPLGCYVMENILFKVSFPAEFHAQTAVEAAIQLHHLVKNNLHKIKIIEIETHEAAKRIIDKTGVLKNPADRDHCLQYMVAIALLHGNLTAQHYEDDAADNPIIDQLRSKMKVTEKKEFTADYFDPSKRAIPNSITVRMEDDTTIGPIEIAFPLGHRRRRQAAIPLIFQKFYHNLESHYSLENLNKIVTLFQDQSRLMNFSVSNLIDLFRN